MADVEMAVAVVEANALDVLTNKQKTELLCQAIREHAFALDENDAMVVASADGFAVQDEADYVRGFELLTELADIEDKCKDHYKPWAATLNAVDKTITAVRKPVLDDASRIKKALSQALGRYKAEKDAKVKAEADERQRVADAAAKASQLAAAETFKRLAAAEPDPRLSASYQQEAQVIAAVPVQAAPVPVAASVPKVTGGFVKVSYVCQFDDLKELLKAFVEGRCYLPEETIIEALQSHMDKQADDLQKNMSKAFPGTSAVPTYGARTRRMK